MIAFVRRSLARIVRNAIAVLALMCSALHLSPLAWAKSGKAIDRESQEVLAELIATISDSDTFEQRLSEELRMHGGFEVAQAVTNELQQTLMVDPIRSKKSKLRRKTLQQAYLSDPSMPQRKTLQQATMVDPCRKNLPKSQQKTMQQAAMTDPCRSNLSKRQLKTLQQALNAEPARNPSSKLMTPGLLEGGSGLGGQGPAATGAPMAPTVPSGITRSGTSGGGLR
jgi:hypothetical protein